jgi:hypothetical protein
MFKTFISSKKEGPVVVCLDEFGSNLDDKCANLDDKNVQETDLTTSRKKILKKLKSSPDAVSL